MPGMFISIEVDDRLVGDPEAARKLVEVCPVDIFDQEDSGPLKIVEDNLDECVLCDLCVQAAPEDSVRIVKLYE